MIFYIMVLLKLKVVIYMDFVKIVFKDLKFLVSDFLIIKC